MFPSLTDLIMLFFSGCFEKYDSIKHLNSSNEIDIFVTDNRQINWRPYAVFRSIRWRKAIVASSYPSVCLYQGERYLTIFREIYFFLFSLKFFFLIILSQPETFNG